MNAIIVTSLLEYVELSTVIAVLVVIGCALLSCQVSSRRPLYYNLFVVEMHTWATRRMVQVLHLGQEFTPPVPWDRLVQRMRARAPRVQGEQRMAISDTNIVIQSPNTVIDSPAPARTPDVDLITLWDIEMPPPTDDHIPDSTRDSQIAAAAAIAILARGDDATMMSRVFRNQERSSDESSGLVPGSDPARRNPQYVTTDVTYTRPALNPGTQHQFSTRTSNVTQTRAPTREVLREEHESSDEGTLEESSSEGSSLDPSEDPETEREQENPEVEEQKPEEPKYPDMIPVIEGPSEGKILIRLKFLNDTLKDTYASLEDTVGKFLGEHFTDLTGKVIRLIFQGQLLRDEHRTLEDYGLKAGSVIHCHVSTTPYQRPEPPVEEPRRRAGRYRRALEEANAVVAEMEETTRQLGGALRRPTEEETVERRRQNRNDRNVGQIYMLLSTLVPILSGFGLAFFRPDRIRDFLRPATLLTVSQWICNLLVDNGLLEQEEEPAENQINTSTLFWIFGGQLVAVVFFFYYFPDVFDRTGSSIFFIVFLYFVFVVYYSRQGRRRTLEQRQDQNEEEIHENRIIHENIRLL